MRKLLTDTDEYICSPEILKLFRAHSYAGIGLLHMIRVRIAHHETSIDTEELKHMLHIKGKLIKIWDYLKENGFIVEQYGEITEDTAMENANKYKKKKNYDKEYQMTKRYKESEMSYSLPVIE